MTMSTRDSPAAPPIHDYVRLLLLAAAMALPIAAAAWGFLQVVDQLQEAVWETWPKNRRGNGVGLTMSMKTQ